MEECFHEEEADIIVTTTSNTEAWKNGTIQFNPGFDYNDNKDLGEVCGEF